MATSLLFIAATVFAIRGFFLGFVGVIGKAIGLVLGYIIALSYRAKCAAWVVANTDVNLPALVIEVGCGAAIFFLTLFTVGFIVSICASLFKRIIPPLKIILDKDSTAGRFTGATTNGLLGVAIVLTGIWGYALLGKGRVEPPELQRFADSFGNALFSIVKEGNRLKLPDINIPSIKNNSLPTRTQAQSSSQGHATIISESNPGKTLSIETTRQNKLSDQASTQQENLIQLLGSGNIQELLKDPQIQQLTLQQLQNNPEQFGEIGKSLGLDSEQLQTLLKEISSQKE